MCDVCVCGGKPSRGEEWLLGCPTAGGIPGEAAITLGGYGYTHVHTLSLTFLFFLAHTFILSPTDPHTGKSVHLV